MMSANNQKRTRSEQTCSFCQNHGIIEPKKGHKEYCLNSSLDHIENCVFGCKVTKDRQQNVACEKREQYKNDNAKLSKTASNQQSRKEPVCKKCENHSIHSPLRGHSMCTKRYCSCSKCDLTEKRRDALKKDAKHRRLRVPVQNESEMMNLSDNAISYGSPDSGYGSPSSSTENSFTSEPTKAVPLKIEDYPAPMDMSTDEAVELTQGIYANVDEKIITIVYECIIQKRSA